MNALSTRPSSALAMPATPNAPATSTAVAHPTAPDRAPASDANASRRFAELLRERRNERADSAPRASSSAEPAVPTTSEPPDDSDTGATEAPASSAAAAAPSAAKARANGARGATGKANVDHMRVAAPGARNGAEGGDDTALPAPTSTDERAASLAVLAANAAQSAANAAPARAADAAPVRGAVAEVADKGRDAQLDVAAGKTTAEASADRAGQARGQAVVDADGARSAAQASVDKNLPASRDPSFQAALADVRHVAELSTSAPRTSQAADSAAASIAAAGAIRSSNEPGNIGPAPTLLALATPIEAPEFAAALGIQVSLLAQDGVQHAELHLNPAETGPVSIHIAVDGTTARVDFGADLAATRHAIERGLPELASALRDAGLTLTGGGVSQHAGNRQGGNGDAPAPRSRHRASDNVPGASSVRGGTRIAAGGVDLYA